MDFTKEEQYRDEFRKILYELATRQEMLQDADIRSQMNKRLEALYYSPKKEDGFRHFYSDIFSVLTQIQQDSSLGNIYTLGQNLALIRSEYTPKNKDENNKIIDIGDNIRKLYDHVNLDIARILYSDAGDRKTSGEEAIIELQTQVSSINVEVQKAKIAQGSIEKEFKQTNEELQNAQKNVENELGKQQREYIAILGIFAAVVLAFTAGIAFSTSILENINTVSVYRIIIMALIIGIVLINILFGLFYYIDKLVNGTNEKKLTPLLIANIVLILLILATITAWYLGVIENRNSNINNITNKQTTTEVVQK